MEAPTKEEVYRKFNENIGTLETMEYHTDEDKNILKEVKDRVEDAYNNDTISVKLFTEIVAVQAIRLLKYACLQSIRLGLESHDTEVDQMVNDF